MANTVWRQSVYLRPLIACFNDTRIKGKTSQNSFPTCRQSWVFVHHRAAVSKKWVRSLIKVINMCWAYILKNLKNKLCSPKGGIPTNHKFNLFSISHLKIDQRKWGIVHELLWEGDTECKIHILFHFTLCAHLLCLNCSDCNNLRLSSHHQRKRTDHASSKVSKNINRQLLRTMQW